MLYQRRNWAEGLMGLSTLGWWGWGWGRGSPGAKEKAMLRSAAFHHQSGLDRALRIVPSTHIPEGSDGGLKAEEPVLPGALGPEAAAVGPSSAQCSVTRLAHRPDSIHSPDISELVYFTLSLLVIIIANINPGLSMYQVLFYAVPSINTCSSLTKNLIWKKPRVL